MSHKNHIKTLDTVV